LLGDPNDPAVREKVLSMLEFGDIAEMWKDQTIDQSQIRRGIEQLKSGQMVEVHEFDNHALWVQEINRLRKTKEFEELAPEAQAAIMSNAEMHIQALMKLTNSIPPESQAPPPPPPQPITEPGAELGPVM
jgi:hypothetical protein